MTIAISRINLSAKLQSVAASVNHELVSVLSSVEPLCQAMLYATTETGGKKLRPFLFMEFAEILGLPSSSLIKIATAIECVHSYSLIHDDLPCMDNDDYRRGLPSVHKKFGESTALLAGNALLTYAFELIVECKNIEDDKKIVLVRELSKKIGAMGMLKGQVLDLADDEDIEEIHLLKTSYLIELACSAAAIIADCSAEKRSAIRGFGHNFGMLFQVHDDLSDYQDANKGDECNIVKQIGLYEAKKLSANYKAAAIETLEIFKEKAVLLRDLVEFVEGI